MQLLVQALLADRSKLSTLEMEEGALKVPSERSSFLEVLTVTQETDLAHNAGHEAEDIAPSSSLETPANAATKPMVESGLVYARDDQKTVDKAFLVEDQNADQVFLNQEQGEFLEPENTGDPKPDVAGPAPAAAESDRLQTNQKTPFGPAVLGSGIESEFGPNTIEYQVQPGDRSRSAGQLERHAPIETERQLNGGGGPNGPAPDASQTLRANGSIEVRFEALGSKTESLPAAERKAAPTGETMQIEGANSKPAAPDPRRGEATPSHSDRRTPDNGASAGPAHVAASDEVPKPVRRRRTDQPRTDGDAVIRRGVSNRGLAEQEPAKPSPLSLPNRTEATGPTRLEVMATGFSAMENLFATTRAIESEDKVSEALLLRMSEVGKTQVAESVRPEPATARAIVNQVVHSVSRSQGEGVVEIRLQPEELGRVRLTMAPAEAGMTVQVAADRPETLDLLRRNIEMLENDLKERGFSDLSFSFGSDGSGNSNASTDSDLTDKLAENVTIEDVIVDFEAPRSQPANGTLDIRV